MKPKKTILWIILVLLSMSACSLPGPFSKTPAILQHPEIEAAQVDLAPFEHLGCDWQEQGYARCDADSLAQQLGCQTLVQPKNYLSLLSPQESAVICYYNPGVFVESDVMAREAIYMDGCSMPVFVRLLVYQDGNYFLIKNKEALQNRFTPIENEGEALAYLLAAKDVSPMFNFDPPKDTNYYLDPIEETYVKKMDDGYHILVYRYNLCGCGSHTTDQELYLVTEDGEIQRIESNPAYSNPEEEGLCVD